MGDLIQTDAMQEADRVMNICNACRYCEGLCATFQAMSLKRSFSGGDLHYLANLCHNCTACYHGCQYAPPHLFNVNVPRALTELRVETYMDYSWPSFLGKLFRRNGLLVSMATALSLTVIVGLSLFMVEPEILFTPQKGPGSFYRIISHRVMVIVAASVFGFSLFALSMGLRRFWKSAGTAMRTGTFLSAFGSALRDATTLKNLGGGHNDGCNTRDEGFSNQRRYFHHATMWGFLLCFASTCVATVYDYGLGRIAPYGFLSVPVLLGTIGGIGLLFGPSGLLWVKLQSDTRPMLVRHFGMDYAFLASLFFISGTGLVLLAVRETAAMGIALVIHLGCVLAMFVTMPYSKFVHAVYRFAALLRFGLERP